MSPFMDQKLSFPECCVHRAPFRHGEEKNGGPQKRKGSALFRGKPVITFRVSAYSTALQTPQLNPSHLSIGAQKVPASKDPEAESPGHTPSTACSPSASSSSSPSFSSPLLSMKNLFFTPTPCDSPVLQQTSSQFLLCVSTELHHMGSRPSSKRVSSEGHQVIRAQYSRKENCALLIA